MAAGDDLPRCPADRTRPLRPEDPGRGHPDPAAQPPARHRHPRPAHLAAGLDRHLRAPGLILQPHLGWVAAGAVVAMRAWSWSIVARAGVAPARRPTPPTNSSAMLSSATSHRPATKWPSRSIPRGAPIDPAPSARHVGRDQRPHSAVSSWESAEQSAWLGVLIVPVRDDLGMQGRSGVQRGLLDVESVAGHLLRPGSVFAFLAEHRRELFADAMFADLFTSGRGRPSVPADVMAAVITLQALHGLSDADAVDAVTFDLRWKAACGLPVTTAAFHATTLTYWRRRLAASERPNRIFEAVKAVVAQTGVLAGRTRRALDSTILDDAVATQDTLTQLIAAIRRVRREVPGAVEVINAACSAHDYDDPGKPAIAWNDEAARAQLVDALVGDAFAVLHGLGEQSEPGAADALGLPALIAGQDVELIDEGSDPPRWQIAQQVAADRVISVADPEARHAHRRCTAARTGSRPTWPSNPTPG